MNGAKFVTGQLDGTHLTLTRQNGSSASCSARLMYAELVDNGDSTVDVIFPE